MKASIVVLLALVSVIPPVSQETVDTGLFTAAFNHLRPGFPGGRTVLGKVRSPGAGGGLEVVSSVERSQIGAALDIEPLPLDSLENLVACPDEQRWCTMAEEIECIVSFDLPEVREDGMIIWAFWSQHVPWEYDGRQIRLVDSRGLQLQMGRNPDGSWRVDRVVSSIRK